MIESGMMVYSMTGVADPKVGEGVLDPVEVVCATGEMKGLVLDEEAQAPLWGKRLKVTVVIEVLD